MRILLVTGLMLIGAAGSRTAGGEAGAPMLDGKWLIVYAEEGGRRNNAWEQRVATIKGTTLSYEAEDKERSIQLTFGPNQTLSAKAGAKTHKGVYIAGQDYLCISLGTGGGKKKNAETGAAGAGAATAEPAAAAAAQKDGHQSSGDFILILRRQRAK